MTLTELFTNIANAIREKKGTTESIVAEDFPSEIESIESGGSGFPPDWSQIGYSSTPNSILDDFNYSKSIYDNWDSTLTSLESKFSGDNSLKFMPLVDTSSATNMREMFYSCIKLETIPLLDTSNVTNMYYMFYNCANLITIPLLDTSNVTTMYGMFYSCDKLETIPLLNTSNVTNMTQMFNGCTNLKTIPLLSTSNVTTFGSSSRKFLLNCSSLSDESLNNIMRMMINATSYTGTKTLNFLGLTSEQATTCQGLSNYADFIAAGWTTGY